MFKKSEIRSDLEKKLKKPIPKKPDLARSGPRALNRPSIFKKFRIKSWFLKNPSFL